MFPLNDFNFVCCALATASAAIGYRYSRQRALERKGQPSQRGRKLRSYSTSSTSSSATLVDREGDFSSEFSAPNKLCEVTEPGSLKRKLRDEDIDNSVSSDNQFESLPRSAPRKRLRSSTPNGEQDSDYVLIQADEAAPEPIPSQTLVDEVQQGQAQGLVQEAELPQATAQTIEEPKEDAEAFTTSPSADASKSSPTLPSGYTIPSYKPCVGFTAFATSSSKFGASLTSSQRSAWQQDSKDSRASGNVAEIVISQPSSNAFGDVLAAQSYVKSTRQNLTGEEDEDVIAEFKGVKLFIKRGDKEFTDGIFGHIKFLSHRESKEERLVFRREHVWKVSMSVRLCPAVRCAFDEEQGILRVTLKEAIDGDDSGPEEPRQHVVVYALRRGKVAKADFTTFAQGVTKSSQLLAALTNAA